MKQNIVVMMLFCSCFFCLDSYASEWPSEALSEHPSDMASMEKALKENAGTRANFFGWVWTRATRSSYVDNRPYLFALALDLYNTTPLDLMPEPRELGSDEDAYEPDNAPIKAQLISDMRAINPRFKRPFEEESSYWNYVQEKLPPDQRAATMEMIYLTNHIRDQIEQGNIAFDAPDAPASLSPEKVDLTNPTHYRALRDYIGLMQPAIAAGVPPWDAEQYLVNAQSEGKPQEQEPVTAQQQPAVQETVDPYASEPAEYKRWIILALLVIGLAVIVYIIRRRRNMQ